MGNGTYFSTLAGANVAVATTAVSFLGAVVYGSAAGTTLSIYDSDGGTLVCTINASSLDSTVVVPAAPVALRSGLACTASGTGGYTVFYGDA